jgi:oligopeptide transport system substrate-binding protein
LSTEESFSTFKFAHEKEPSTYDPQICGEAACSIPLFHAVNTLYTINEKNQLILSGASQHVVFEKGLVHIFEIRKSQWHDGQPILAQHYVEGFQRLADPETGAPLSFLVERLNLKNASEVLKGIKPPQKLGIQALSDRTLMLTLERPCSHLSPILSLINFAPYRKDQLKIQKNQINFIGSGPFYLKVLDQAQSIYELTPFANFNGYPLGNLEKIKSIGVISEPVAELQRYQTGETDLLIIRSENFSRALHKKHQIKVAPTALYHLEVNVRPNQLFNHPLLRKAVHYGLNREHLVHKIIGLPGFKSAYGFVPQYITTKQGKPYQSFSQITNQYDLKKSKVYLQTYLKDTKQTSIPPINFICGYQGNLKQQCQFLQTQLGNLLNTEVVLNPLPFSLTRERLKKGLFDVALIAWVPDYSSPESFLSVYKSTSYGNYAGYQSPQYDQLLEIAAKQIEEEKAFKIYSEIEKKLIEDDTVTIPCYEGASLFTTREQFSGIIRRNIATEFDFRFVKYRQIEKKK